MQTPATTKPRKAFSEKLQYPNLPESSADPLFSIAWLLRKIAERAALEAARRTEYLKKRENQILTHAMTGAIMELDCEERSTIAMIQRKGLLPFAWHGTTVLQHPARTQGGAA